jgi:predicted metal-dependent HD superfamily phosphohydrolase
MIGSPNGCAHVAKCQLHLAVIYSRLNRHEEALACLNAVLQMVEQGRLHVGGSNPQKLCMIAVCYHNVAVEYIITRRIAEACASSQNARRLARLCLRLVVITAFVLCICIACVWRYCCC